MFGNLLIAGLAILLTACVPFQPKSRQRLSPLHKCRPAWMILRRSSPR